MRYETKIIFNSQRRNKHFLIVFYHSSLGAMNAARLCKLRKGVKKKTPQFFLISMGKSGPSAQ
jgi:hypothetical protein